MTPTTPTVRAVRNWATIFALTLATTASARQVAIDGVGKDLAGLGKAIEAAADDAAVETAPATQPDLGAKIYADIAAFGERVNTLPPEQAATEWLGLFGKAIELGPIEYEVGPPPAQRVFEVLPPPEAWGVLCAKIRALPVGASGPTRESTALLLLACALEGHPELASAEFKKLTDARPEVLQDYSLHNVEGRLAALAGTPGETFEEVRDQVAALRNQRFGSFQVPNLVTLFGEKRAEILLRQILSSGNAYLYTYNTEKQTMALARKLLLEQVDAFPEPKWDFVETLDAVELYEAFDKQFPVIKPEGGGGFLDALLRTDDADENRDTERDQASLFHMFGLLKAQRAADARKAFEALPANVRGSQYAVDQEIRAAKLVKAAYDFLTPLMPLTTSAPLWALYADYAFETATPAELIKLVDETSKRTDLSIEIAVGLRQRLTRMYLAHDEVDKALVELRGDLSTMVKVTDPTARVSPADLATAIARMGETGFEERVAELIFLGKALGRPELIDEGLAAHRTFRERSERLTASGRGGALVSLDRYSDDDYPLPVSDDFGDMLITAGRPADAVKEGLAGMQRYHDAVAAAEKQKAAADEKRKAEAQKRSADPKAQADPDDRDEDDDRDVFAAAAVERDEQAGDTLVALAVAYDAAGQPAEVMKLLDTAPQWRAADAAGLIGQYNGRMGLAVARALVSAGKKEQAVAVVHAVLADVPNHDPAYSLLLDLSADDTARFLDSLAALDASEARPLIWKAELQRRAGKLDDAEKSARAALAIDPSDIGQPAGDRLRAWAVLAEILKAKGDAPGAEVLLRRVKAARIAEDADLLEEAGLKARAVARYQEASAVFDGDYVVHTAAASLLSELGRADEAAAAYSRSFALMPGNVGRDARYFYSIDAGLVPESTRALAEKIFTDQLAKTPGDARVSFLLGVVRQAQGRDADAATLFQAAIKLDPDYLAAWDRLGHVAEAAKLSPAERDGITLALLRLDPLQRHSSISSDGITDLRAVCTQLRLTEKLTPEPPKQLYPLAAARPAPAPVPEPPRRNPFRPTHTFGHGTAATVLSQHPVISAAGTLVGAGLD